MVNERSRSRREFIVTLAAAMTAHAGFANALQGRFRPANEHCSMHGRQPCAEGAAVGARQSALSFESSDRTLVKGFHWAKAQALAYVRDDGTVGPWYEAALPGRNSFCMRDVSHMSTGAHLLGLGAQTRNMLHHFAEHISASRKWCTWWEITRDGQPAPVDYKSDTDFWYDLPANFDVLDACYRQWEWTRNAGYLDPTFTNFYRETVTRYVQAWERDHTGLLQHLPDAGHMGIATYDEDLQDDVSVGADLIAAQFAAYRDYAEFQRARGDAQAAPEFDRKAQQLKTEFNRRWWNETAGSYYGALGNDGKPAANLREGSGRGTIEFPLYYGLTEKGFKTEAALNHLEARLKLDADAIHAVVGGVEGRSYLPDIFYRYDRTHAGYTALTAMMDPRLKRREYPEVSYSVIGNLGAGLMGIRPLRRDEMVETFPHLTEATEWAELKHLPIGPNVISVRHNGNIETALTNEAGPELEWHAVFPGKMPTLVVDQEELQSKQGERAGGAAASSCVVRVATGETRAVRAGKRNALGRSIECSRAVDCDPVGHGFESSCLEIGVIALATEYSRREVMKGAAASLALAGLTDTLGAQTLAERVTRYDYAPGQRNVPLGTARGIFPGRVVWVRDPKAAHWSGNRTSVTDQWWMDTSTGQDRVDEMLSEILHQLTGAASDAEAWQKIFDYYHTRATSSEGGGYQAGQIVAVKVNLNNSKPVVPTNLVNVSPQAALAMVRQLVEHAHVAPADILVYDAQRNIYPGMLDKIWRQYKEVRFVQKNAPDPEYQKHPAYGRVQNLEEAKWVEGMSYSAGSYQDARFIPQQVMDATYIVNLALLKAHSYPYAAAEGGDEGQTGVTLTAKNHFGSIKGPRELHAIINTDQGATPHAYSPMVDLSAAPKLGAKTILYMLDGLYCARRHMSYPLHFPNAPFHNPVEPYANPNWPSSLLGSLDGVATDSVGLDILYSQTKNNLDSDGHPRIVIRENAEDYLLEEAQAERPPSGTEYRQAGKQVRSLGVFEHWDHDDSRLYSRNKDPQHGEGIELVYLATS